MAPLGAVIANLRAVLKRVSREIFVKEELNPHYSRSNLICSRRISRWRFFFMYRVQWGSCVWDRYEIMDDDCTA